MLLIEACNAKYLLSACFLAMLGGKVVDKTIGHVEMILVQLMSLVSRPLVKSYLAERWRDHRV